MVFTAIGIGVMFDINKGIGDRYKLAEAVYARSQELTEIRIAVHAAMISFGVIVGVLATLLYRMMRIVGRKRS